jgi:protein TonB
MRLTLSLLAAVGLHGALFGVAAVVLPRAPVKNEAPVAIEVEVEVVAPKPDPIADSAPPANPVPAPPKPPVARRVRQVALVDDTKPTSALAEPSTDANTPTVAAAAPSISPSPGPATPVHASASAAQSGGAVVSAKPRYHTNPKPDYPIPSLRRREEGIVLLNVLVQADGTPATISLNRSCGHPLLDRAALEAVHRWTFEPAHAGGVPVSSLVVVPVRFSLAEHE